MARGAGGLAKAIFIMARLVGSGDAWCATSKEGGFSTALSYGSGRCRQSVQTFGQTAKRPSVHRPKAPRFNPAKTRLASRCRALGDQVLQLLIRVALRQLGCGVRRYARSGRDQLGSGVVMFGDQGHG